MSGKKARQNIWDAARAGNVSAIRAALAAGADIDAQEDVPEGMTPLILAICGGHPDAAKELLDAGADVEVWAREGGAPLHAAAAGGRLDMVALLLAHGADTGSRGGICIAATPLHQAAWGGHADVVRVLLEAGAGFGAVDDNGRTPLHFAATDYSFRHGGKAGENSDVVRLLLAAGAKVDCADNSGDTPLHVAARDGCPEVAAVLIGSGADVDAVNGSGESPLHLASLRGAAARHNALLRGGSLPHLAEFHRHQAVATLLLEAGADPSRKDGGGLTPLMRGRRLVEKMGWLEDAIAKNTPELRKVRMIGQWRARHRRLAALRPKAPTL